jgi:cytochrome d ubiquinol oxidase subunit II
MTYPFDLNIAWFLLVGILLTGYAILDGFDLGVGMLYLFSKGDGERRTLLNAIGPVWDGNEVWLIVGGGAIFAAFPHVYATVFSGLYLPFFLLLTALIFRAVAIEFRSKEESPLWRRSWDTAFSIASLVIALLAGVALGNIVIGLPIGSDMEYTGGFFNLLNPYALIIGVTTVALFMMHGSLYLVVKTEDELQAKARKWFLSSFAFFVVCYVLASVATVTQVPRMLENMSRNPILYVVPAINVLAIVGTVVLFKKKKDLMAFLSSSLNIACLLGLVGMGLFPNIVPSSTNPAFNLTLYNAASSQASLTTMFSITLIGMPLVLAYTSVIYWIFRGKVKTAHIHY